MHLFQKFKLGNLSLYYEARGGRPQILIDEGLNTTIEEDSGKLASQFNMPDKTDYVCTVQIEQVVSGNCVGDPQRVAACILTTVPVIVSGFCMTLPRFSNI